MAWRRARSAGGSGSAMRRSAHTSGRLAASWERIPWSTPSSRRETWSWSARPLSRIGLVEERPQPKPEKVRMCLQGPQQRNAVKPPHVVLADHHSRVTPTHHLESLLIAEHLLLGDKHLALRCHLADDPDHGRSARETLAEICHTLGHRTRRRAVLEAHDIEQPVLGSFLLYAHSGRESPELFPSH